MCVLAEVTPSTGPNADDKDVLEIVVSQDPRAVEAGSTPHLTCRGHQPVSSIWWSQAGRNLTSVREPTTDYLERLDLRKAGRQDSGNYTCGARLAADGRHVQRTVNIRVIGEWIFDER